jgi:outer membrane protein insertion porin family
MNKLPLLLLSIPTLILAQTHIKDIEFEGLHHISKEMALDTINLSIGERISEREIDNSIKEFYKYGYFDDIVVENNQGTIKFIFKEKPSIINIEVKNYKDTNEDGEDTILNDLGIKKGDLLSLDRIKNAKKRLLRKLEDEGLIDSIVEYNIENISPETVSLVFDVQKGQNIILNKVSYNGASSLNKDDFEDLTLNNEAQSFGWFFGRNDGELKINELQNDALRIKEIYMQNGFLDATVDTPLLEVDFYNYKSTLNFDIEENSKYSINDISLEISSDIKDVEALKESLSIKSGETFNIENLRKDIEKIRTHVANQGYAYTKVYPDFRKDSVTNSVDVIYKVIEGNIVYINDVIISGNQRTIDRVIRREIYLAPKDMFNLTDLTDSKNALQRTGYFDSVHIEQKRVSYDKIDLIVHVKEAPTGNIMVGGGYGSYDGLLLNASVSDKNIFGSGLNLGLGIDSSSRQSRYYISLYNPRIKDSTYTGSFEIHNNENEIYYDEYRLTQISKGASVGVGKKYNRFTNLFLKYRFDNITEEYEEYSEEEEEYVRRIDKDDEYSTSSITPSFTFNNTDDFYVPRNGIIFSSSVEFAGLGGDSKFARNINSFRYYKGLEDAINYDLIFRYKANLNVLADMGQITKGSSFYLGGVNSVRGYKSYAFGPDSIDDEPFKKFFSNSLELSMPLIEDAKMRLAFFLDYGMIGENNFTEYKKSGTGAAIEWFSPVGPVQFIFAKAINPEDGDPTSDFEFNLGQKF